MAKMNPALRDYLTKLREDAYIDLARGYEDSAASSNEMKPVYSAYTPPAPKKKHVERTRFRERGRNATKAAPTQTAAAAAPAAPAPPPGVPTLADVPQGTATAKNADLPAAPASATAPATPAPASTAANTQVATNKSGTMKPGKKEKIRFGQAPRETLPAADTKTEDAGAGSGGAQVASNAGPSTVHTLNPDGTVANPDTEAPKQKTRFQARARIPKDKQQKEPKTDPFAPAPATHDETADRQQQSQALGLNGDTSKVKTPNPAKTGPKRRMSDQKKNGEQPDSTTPAPSTSAPSSAQPSAPASQTGSDAPTPSPASPAAPATPNK
jgi:peptidyl-prolyl cis-trans isomerase SurA